MSSRHDLVEQARMLGEQVAGCNADDVDRNARFPAETFAAIRDTTLLGALIPQSAGGVGATVEDLVPATAMLASYCASSALILAMHHIQVAQLVGHASDKALADLAPRITSGQLLLANANSEVGKDGARRSSSCALEPMSGRLHLEKQASTVSFGEYADGILATARSTPDGPDSEQSLAICVRPGFTLESSGEWDTLGLRGTCSRPGRLVADLDPEFVIGDYASVFARTSLPVSILLLGSVWLGIAEAASRAAHTSVKRSARAERAAGTTTTSLKPVRLAELGLVLQQLRDGLAAAAADYERVKGTPELESLTFSARLDNVKITTSTLAVDVVMRALVICGLPGYMNNSPVTLARLVRDVVAAPLMVSNDRALQSMAQTLLIRKEL